MSTSRADRLAELERLARQSARREAWQKIMRLAVQSPPQFWSADTVAMLEDYLRDWPDEVRVIGADPDDPQVFDAWLDTSLRPEGAGAYLRLARTLHLDLGRLPKGDRLSTLCRDLASLTTVILPSLPTEKVAERVFAQLQGVRALVVESCKPSSTRLLPMLRVPGLAGLTTLSMHDGGARDGTLADVLAGPLAERLESLEWRGARLSAKDITRLFGWPRFRSLRSLRLGGNGLDDAFLHAWPRRAPASQLAELELSEQEFSESALSALLDSLRSSPLVQLRLRTQGLAEQAAVAVAGVAPGTLRNLDLAGNLIGPTALATLLRGEAAPMLKRLDLTSNQIGDEGAVLLARHKSLGGLESLHLVGNQISAVGRRALDESPHLSPSVRAILRTEFAYESGSSKL